MTREKTIHNKIYMDLIQLLVTERQRLGLSQAEVASQLGLTQSEVSKVETLERRLDTLEFQQLLSVYRVNENKKLRHAILEFLEIY